MTVVFERRFNLYEKAACARRKNYDESLEEIYRIAVRGIVFKDGRLLMIESNNGELKFPGGGMEDDEDDIKTLIRETLEETGFTVVPETVR